MIDQRDNSEFRLHQYDQAWNNINRHILTVWQSATAVAAALAAIVFSEKEILSNDIAASLIILFSAWLMAHVYDAQTWYDRNLALIQDNEKYFQNTEEEFGSYLQPRKMRLITHLRIQRDLGVVLASLAVGTHFFIVVMPVMAGDECVHPSVFLPYFAFIAWAFYVSYSVIEWKAGHRKAYQQR